MKKSLVLLFFALLFPVNLYAIMVNTPISLSGPNVVGVLPATKGGTGQSGYTTGNILYASSAIALSKLDPVATGNVLRSAGITSAPIWGKVDLSGSVSNKLSVVNGGTGVSTLNGLVKANGTSAFTSVADNSTNWNTAYTDRLKWDGGATGLTASTGRTSLGLVIGTDVQAYNANLAAIAGLTSEANTVPYFTGSGTASLSTFTANGRSLVSQSSSANMRSVLVLGNVENTAISTWAGSTNLTTLGTITTGAWTGTTIAIANGGTGSTSKSNAFNALSPMTTLGDIIYGGAAGTGTRLAGNVTTTVKALLQTGSGAASAQPEWTAIPTSISGTASQVSVSGATGAITISLPQNIATGSTPQFSGITLTNHLAGTTAVFSGNVTANAFIGTSMSATNIGITNDTTTDATMYPVWVTSTSGNLPAKVSSSKLSFNPSTGILNTISLNCVNPGGSTLATFGDPAASGSLVYMIVKGNTRASDGGILSIAGFNKQSGLLIQSHALDFVHEGSSADNKGAYVFSAINSGTSLVEVARIGSNGVITGTGFTSTVTTGTSPLIVSSTTRVSNLNVATAGNADTATALANSRSIYGNNFNGSADLSQVISSTYGGTGSGFTKFSGAATTEKTYALPNSSATILTDAVAVTVPQGGTGVATLNGLVKANGTSAFTSVADNSTNWNSAYTQRLQWDGGATNLVAATGRTSLGLGSMATQPVTNFITTQNAFYNFISTSDAAATYQPLSDILTGFSALPDSESPNNSRQNSIPFFTSNTGSIAIAFTDQAVSFVSQDSSANMRSVLVLGNVENTALSTWAGSTNLTTLGQIGTISGVTPTLNITSGLVVDTNTLFVKASNNRVGIGTTVPGAALEVSGNIRIGPATGGDSNIRWQGTNNWDIALSNSADIFKIRRNSVTALAITGDKYVGMGGIPTPNRPLEIGTSTPLRLSAVGASTGTALVIDGSGDVYKLTSSRRYKEKIEPLDLDSSLIYMLEPKDFCYKIEDWKTGSENVQSKRADIGFIAEDVEDVGLGKLVNYDNEGRPDSLKDYKFYVPIIMELKKLRARIEELEGKK